VGAVRSVRGRVSKRKNGARVKFALMETVLKNSGPFKKSHPAGPFLFIFIFLFPLSLAPVSGAARRRKEKGDGEKKKKDKDKEERGKTRREGFS
jgi:hypothetical protein